MKLGLGYFLNRRWLIWLSLLLLGSCGRDLAPADSKNLIRHHFSTDGPVIAETTMPPLIAATLAGDRAVVSRLLGQGTDPNLVYNTNTALTYAARDGFTDIARLLIDHGADVNWIDGEGVTPLILASFKNHIDLVELLLAHGADITVRDQWHRTALDYALRRGPADPIARLLREKT